MNQTDIGRLVADIFYASLKAVDPGESVRSYTGKIRSVYVNGRFKRLHVAGFGKAACPMADALGAVLGDIIDSGIVITKYGHVSSQRSAGSLSRLTHQSSLRIFEAGHPVPDENGVKGTDEIIKLLQGSDESTLVVCLISGGGSALLVSPYQGISLAEKQEITQLLLKAGADIHELNCVRKHISGVKGGRLAEIAYPAKVISLILSDVIGDKLDVIASGPTSPDTATYEDAVKVLEKYRLTDKAPQGIVEVLRNGAKDRIPETPKEGNRIFSTVENIIIGSNRIALDAAKKKAEELGYRTEILSSELTGEARDVAGLLAEKVRQLGSSEVQRNKRPLCLISGGETTVTVTGNGLGGRNMELALAFAMEIGGMKGVTLLSAGTDGTDGPTDAAGAIVDGETVRKARDAGLEPAAYLKNNDSYTFFRKIGGLFITGPTGTNVMDMQIVLFAGIERQ